ncbi:MAG: hypothetical protein ACK53L_07765, partial [Pirellulaceae bacterium]
LRALMVIRHDAMETKMGNAVYEPCEGRKIFNQNRRSYLQVHFCASRNQALPFFWQSLTARTLGMERGFPARPAVTTSWSILFVSSPGFPVASTPHTADAYPDQARLPDGKFKTENACAVELLTP